LFVENSRDLSTLTQTIENITIWSLLTQMLLRIHREQKKE